MSTNKTRKFFHKVELKAPVIGSQFWFSKHNTANIEDPDLYIIKNKENIIEFDKPLGAPRQFLVQSEDDEGFTLGHFIERIQKKLIELFLNEINFRKGSYVRKKGDCKICDPPYYMVTNLNMSNLCFNTIYYDSASNVYSLNLF